MNFDLITGQPGLLLGLTFGLIAFKWLLFFALGTPAKLSKIQRLIFATIMSQGSEFAFVIVGVSAQLGLTDRSVSELLIAVVALSMAATPFLNLITDHLLIPRLSSP
ncbi:hypothetical protein RZS08_00545, partial [Arthrospira platensis SPKY1]|nr:hypothetical protein [Arthrospira platensis SPKY1]